MKRPMMLLVAAALSAMPVTVHAQSLTLACNGKMNTGGDNSEPVNNMGIVVDLTTRTVSGFGGVVARVDRFDAASVSFNGTDSVSGFQGLPPLQVTVFGDIDRVTGAVTATQTSTWPAMGNNGRAQIYSYELMCRPANRLF